MDPITLKKFTLIGLLSSFVFYSCISSSHGYVEKPKARQQFCVDDGGYWWPEDGSSIPNAACRSAFIESGTFQFVQNIEFAANVTDYLNIQAVKNVVKDGLLCAAGDASKRGMDVPSAEWQKSIVIPDQNGEFEVLFFGATPHNPSFWEFYLTKTGFDSSTEKVTWDSLELIDQKGDIPIVQIDGRNMYRMSIKIPAGRTGDAVLFTRWQRNDVAGEGFYNCSDITIKEDPGNPIDWFDKGYFVKQGQETVPGDEVWFRLFDSTGNELIFEKLTIDANNSEQNIWAEQISSRVNSKPNSGVKIGVFDRSGNIKYDPLDTLSNKVWAKDNSHTFALDIKKPNFNYPPSVELAPHHRTDAGQSIIIDSNATDPEGDSLVYRWQIPAPLQSNSTNSSSVTILGHSPGQTTEFELSVQVSDGVNQVVKNSILTVFVAPDSCSGTDPDAVNYESWIASKTYRTGDLVAHKQLVWKANWWNDNEEPSIASQAWSLVSNVELGWQAGVPYSKDEEVNHSSRRWKAKWWTTGEPGVSSDWTDIGPSTCPTQ